MKEHYKDTTTPALKGEEWRPIPDYLDYYASSYGRIKSKKRSKPKILKQILNRNRGVLVVRLAGKHKTVHRLVGLTFLNNPKNLPHVQHKDSNNLNNFLSNLVFGDHKSLSKRVQSGHINNKGKAHYLAKLTSKDVLLIRSLREDGAKLKSLAERFSVSISAIDDIVNRRNWKHLN